MAAKPPALPDPAIRRPGAERAAAEQAIFMREVDEAVRQDQVSDVARRYGLVIIGGIVLVLALFAGWLFWQSRSEARLEDQSIELVTAVDQLEAGNDRVADAQLVKLASDGGPASAAAAKLLRAGVALQQNRSADAAKLFDEVAGDSAVPTPYRDFASIRAVSLGYDTLTPRQVIDRLGPLAVPTNAWFGSAGELVALAYLAQGNKAKAGPLLVAIAHDDKAPETLRARVRQLAGLLGYDAVEDVDATLAALGQQGGPGAPAAGSAPSQTPVPIPAPVSNPEPPQ